MPRIGRVVGIGYPHHITQRGNYQQAIFETGEDYAQYLQWLKEYSNKYSLKIWGYCLMSNHVHFIAVPMKKDSLAKTFNTLHMRYSQYYNKKRNVKGHLWQGRFYSCILDERHVYAAIRYVENNPKRAGIVTESYKYKWSSAYSHVNKESDSILSEDCYLLKNIKDWVAYLNQEEEEMIIRDIKNNTNTGRPCGDKSFIMNIEEILNRKLKALPHGRPKKNQ